MRSHRHTTFSIGCVLAMLGLIVVGCAGQRVDMGHGPHEIDPSDYQDVLARWSRTVRVLPIDGLENILTAEATYLSHELRYAYVVRMAHDLNLVPDERQKLNDAEMSALDKGHELFVSLMSGVRNCDKLEPDERVWTIRMKDDRGREVSPISVVEVKKPTPNEIKYFSFDARLRKAYRLTFPLNATDGRPIISAQTAYFELSFATAYGSDSVRWELR